jgi:hypothetical protein
MPQHAPAGTGGKPGSVSGDLRNTRSPGASRRGPSWDCAPGNAGIDRNQACAAVCRTRDRLFRVTRGWSDGLHRRTRLFLDLEDVLRRHGQDDRSVPQRGWRLPRPGRLLRQGNAMCMPIGAIEWLRQRYQPSVMKT